MTIQEYNQGVQDLVVAITLLRRLPISEMATFLEGHDDSPELAETVRPNIDLAMFTQVQDFLRTCNQLTQQYDWSLLH